MQRMGDLLTDVGRFLQRLWVRASSGQRMLGIVSALGLLALTGTLALMNMRPAGPQQTARSATATPTLAPTDTPSPTATLKPTPRPTPAHPIVKAPPPPPVPTRPPATPTPKPVATGTPGPTPTPCGPGAYLGGNPTQSQIRQALDQAADDYGLPRNLLLAVAWEESRWHQDVYACDGGIGLMQIQDTTGPWLNQQSVPQCGLAATSYDVTNYEGNAHLGAKYLKYLSCFWSYWGNNGGTSVRNPGKYTIAWYYEVDHAPPLQYPDTKNADGSPNPTSACAQVFTTEPWYPALPSTNADPWSCPFDTAPSDNTLLDVTISAYNAGPGTVIQKGITNWTYVHNIEGYIPQFQSGTLPTPS